MIDPDDTARDLADRLDAELAAAAVRVRIHEQFAARAELLAINLRAQLPARSLLIIVGVTAAGTVPVEMWQALAPVWGWHRLPDLVSRVAAAGVPLLLVGLLILGRRTRTGFALIAVAVAWVTAVELGWPVPVWAEAIIGPVNATVCGVFLLSTGRRVLALRRELRALRADAPPPAGLVAALPPTQRPGPPGRH